MGFLGFRFGVYTLSPPRPLRLNRVRIMLETWDLVRKYTHVHIPFSTKTFLIQHFLAKNSTFTQNNIMSTVLEVLEFCFQVL